MSDIRKNLGRRKSFIERIVPPKQRNLAIFMVLIYSLYFIFTYGRFFYLLQETSIYENETYHYSLKYPAPWVVAEYPNGYKNLNDVSVIIRNGDFFSISKPTTKTVEIHHRYFDLSNEETINEVITWGKELIEIKKGIGQSELLNTFDEISVGALNHPALMQKYKQGITTRWFIFLAIGNEGYMIVFATNNSNSLNDWNIFFEPILMSLNF